MQRPKNASGMPGIRRNNVRYLYAFPGAAMQPSLEPTVTDFVQALGVPANIKGYHFLREAILFSVEHQSMLVSYSNALYPHIAGVYLTTPSHVESSIRYALRVAWDRMDKQGIQKAYPFMRAFAAGGKPPNAALIAKAADYFAMNA